MILENASIKPMFSSVALKINLKLCPWYSTFTITNISCMYNFFFLNNACLLVFLLLHFPPCLFFFLSIVVIIFGWRRWAVGMAGKVPEIWNGILEIYLTPNEFVARGKVFRVMGHLECPIAFIFTGVSIWA
jgi:hypothetical protein